MRGVVLALLLTGCGKTGVNVSVSVNEEDVHDAGPSVGPSPGPSTSTSTSTSTGTGTGTLTGAIGLACVAKYYGAAVGGDHLVLPDGTTIPWDDGRTKTLEQKLAGPDVEDVLSIAYRSGPITPVTTIDEDPGRIRLDALFRATYGDGAKAVRAELVPWTLLGQTVVVHRKALPAFQRVGARLEAAVKADATLAPFLHDLGGTFVWRVIAGTDRQSAHSYGVSLDIDPGRSDYWRSQSGGGKVVWRNRIPQAIVDAFEAEKFIWGGRWYHYDTMHFEYRPELFSPCP